MGTIDGGWTAYSTTISAEETQIFKDALGGMVGVNYSPIAVSSQVVAGTNYHFFCNAQVVYPNAPNTAVLITIFKPLNDKAHVVSIHQVV